MSLSCLRVLPLIPLLFHCFGLIALPFSIQAHQPSYTSVWLNGELIVLLAWFLMCLSSRIELWPISIPPILHRISLRQFLRLASSLFCEWPVTTARFLLLSTILIGSIVPTLLHDIICFSYVLYHQSVRRSGRMSSSSHRSLSLYFLASSALL